MNTNRHADRAKHLLRHYLSFAVRASGNQYDADCASEIDEIVDAIIAAVVEELQSAQPAPAFAQPAFFPAGEDTPLFTQPAEPEPDDQHLNCSRCNRHPAESGLARWQGCDVCGAPVCDTCAWQTNDGVYCSHRCMADSAPC